MTRPAHIVCMFLLVLLAASVVSAQMSEKDVRARLDDIYAGKASDVRAELPQLLEKYPQDVGVLYLQAVLTMDGAAAVKRYEEIVKKYPQSAWADDALYKVYQYDFSTGLYKKADSVMAQLRADYPTSIYAVAAAGDEKKSEAPAAPAVKTDESAKRSAAPATTKTDEAVKPAASRAAKGVVGGYDVQAGVFSTEANARSAAGRLGVVSGREARVKPKTSGERTVYLVVFEGFETAESARRFSTELRTKHNIDSFVNPR